MDLSGVDKHSSQTLAIAAVVFSCLGGIEIEMGIDGLMGAKSQYHWIGSFILGAAFLGYGIFWVMMLVRRTRPSELPSEKQST